MGLSLMQIQSRSTRNHEVIPDEYRSNPYMPKHKYYLQQKSKDLLQNKAKGIFHLLRIDYLRTIY